MGAVRFTIDEQLIKFFQSHLSLDIFVETGTYEGDNLAIAQKHFKACFSVEKSPSLFEKAIERFSSKENVFIEQGDSSELLSKIRDNVIETPTLFWLDAHNCNNAITPHVLGEESSTAILGELAAIEQLNPDSVLIIDDARLYLCGAPKPNNYKAWPDMQDIMFNLFALSEQHRITIYDDTIVFYPERLRDPLMFFSHENSIDTLGAMLDARSYRESKNNKGSKSSWLRLKK